MRSLELYSLERDFTASNTLRDRERETVTQTVKCDTTACLCDLRDLVEKSSQNIKINIHKGNERCNVLSLVS